MSETPSPAPAKSYARPIDDPSFTEFEAMQELKLLQEKSNSEGLTALETERAVSLVRMLRRTNTGPSAAKAAKSKKAEYQSKSLDDLLA